MPSERVQHFFGTGKYIGRIAPEAAVCGNEAGLEQLLGKRALDVLLTTPVIRRFVILE